MNQPQRVSLIIVLWVHTHFSVSVLSLVALSLPANHWLCTRHLEKLLIEIIWGLANVNFQSKKYFCWFLLCTCGQGNLLPGITLIQLRNFIKFDHLLLGYSLLGDSLPLVLPPMIKSFGVPTQTQGCRDSPVVGDTAFSSVCQAK